MTVAALFAGWAVSVSPAQELGVGDPALKPAFNGEALLH
jgi:hypothetical protein